MTNFPLVKRRWWVRLRNTYRIYRRIGQTRWQAFRSAWYITWA